MCDQAGVVIGAADRMLTSGDIEFEPPQTKMLGLTSSIAALLAGDAAFQIEIMNKVQTDIGALLKANPTEWLTVEAVSKMYERHYGIVRRNRAENRLLVPLGLDAASFISSQRQMNSELVQKLAGELLNFEVPETAVIFCGVDSDRAHIYTAHNGAVSCDDVVGFSAIGAGENHADSQLMFAAHTKWKGFADALLTTYTAKKRSEVAPGVGTATDMFYIGPTLGSYSQIGNHVLAKLETIYREEQRKQNEARRESLELTNAYIEELTQSSTTKEQSETPKDSGRTSSADKQETSTEQPNKDKDGPTKEN